MKKKQYRKLLDKLVKMKWITVNPIIDIDAIAENFVSEHDKIERALMLEDTIRKIIDMKHFYSGEMEGFIKVIKTLCP